MESTVAVMTQVLVRGARAAEVPEVDCQFNGLAKQSTSTYGTT